MLKVFQFVERFWLFWLIFRLLLFWLICAEPCVIFAPVGNAVLATPAHVALATKAILRLRLHNNHCGQADTFWVLCNGRDKCVPTVVPLAALLACSDTTTICPSALFHTIL